MINEIFISRDFNPWFLALTVALSIAIYVFQKDKKQQKFLRCVRIPLIASYGIYLRVGLATSGALVMQMLKKIVRFNSLLFYWAALSTGSLLYSGMSRTAEAEFLLSEIH